MEPVIIGTVNENKLREIIVDSCPVIYKNCPMEAAFYRNGNIMGVIFVKEGDTIHHRTLPDTKLWDVFYSYQFKDKTEANGWVFEMKKRAGVPMISEFRQELDKICKIAERKGFYVNS